MLDFQTYQTLNEHFYLSIKQAQSILNITLDERIEYYLVELASEFKYPHNITCVDMLHEALKQSPNEKFKTYRKTGDFCLITLSLFDKGIKRRNLSCDYYENMGYHTYSSAAELIYMLHKDRNFASIYYGLADNIKTISKIMKIMAGLLPESR
jgi:hypothetical protein